MRQSQDRVFCVKRTQAVKRLRDAAQAAGLEFREQERTNHTAYYVGDLRSMLRRHNEIDEITVVKWYKQYEDALGEGWWKK